MRILAALTVLAFCTIVSGASASTGQTRVSSTNELVAQYHKFTAHNNQLARKFLCRGTKHYLIQKRNATWKWQEASLLPRTRTSYSERNTKCSPHLKWYAQLWAHRADEAFHSYQDLDEPQEAICHVFGNYCSEALAVSACESGHSIYAHNGQYLGLFQMGSYARSKYGHSNTAIGQARSAYAYFIDSGRDWSPWSCKPY